MQKISPCPDCGSSEVYLCERGIAGGGYAANYLPGLGRFLQTAKFYPAVCENCGLTRLFAEKEARKKLSGMYLWQKVESS